MQRGRLRAQLLAAASLAAMLTGLSQASTAANFTVTNTNDTGAGSLRDAITNSDNAGGSNNINVQPGLSGQVTLGSSLPTVTTSTAIDFSSGSSTSIFLAGSGGIGFNASGVSLSAPAFQSYTGATALQGGTLSVVNAGYNANNSPLTMTSGTTLNVNAVTTFASLSGSGTLNLNSAVGLSLTGHDLASTSFGGAIAGPGSFTMLGGGVTLTGANTYSGATFINGGTVALGPGGSIASSNQLAVNGGGTFDISAAGNQTVRNLAGGFGAGVVKLGANTLTDVNTGANFFQGVISGTGGLTLQGSGSLGLNNVSTYTGATTINGGTLALVANGSIAATSGINLAAAGATFDISGLGGRTVTIKDLSGVAGTSLNLGPANLTVGTANSTTFGGVISGVTPINGLLKQGSGTLTLTGINTYIGPTIINAGTLALGAGGSLASSNQLGVNGGGTFDISAGGNQTVQNLAGGFGAGLVSLGANTLTDVNAGSNFFQGRISGSGGFTLQGSGTLTLNNVQTYTGPTTINGGTLAFLSNGSIAASSGVNLAASGATFSLASAPGNQTIKDLSGVAGSSLNLGPANLTVGTANSTTFAGVISGLTPINGLSKQGSGTLTLTGVNTYIGPTFINAGTLALGPGGSLGSSNQLAVNGGGTFDISAGGNQTVQSLAGGFGAGLVKLGANTLTDVNAGSNLFQGVISGTGGLTLQGSGTLGLNNVSTYTGPTTVNGGTLALLSTGSVAASSGVNLAASGATFSLASAPGNQTIKDLSGVAGSSLDLGPANLTVGTANSTTFSGVISGLTPINGLTKQGSGTLTLTSAATYPGPTIINAGTLALGPGGSLAKSSGVNLAGFGLPFGTTIFDISRASGGGTTIQDLAGIIGTTVNLGANNLTAGSANSTIFAGAINGSGGLTKQGTGTLSLSGINTYTGATTVNAGTLAISGVGGGSIAASSGVNLAAPGATFDISHLAPFDLPPFNLPSIKDLTGVAGTVVSLGPELLSVGTGNSTNFAGVFTGTGPLFKQGIGTLTLDGNSTGYTGSTTVTAGRLAIGSTSAAGLGGAVTVQSGATVSGHGRIGGALANLGGTVMPGGSIGTLTVGDNYTQSSAGTLLIQADSTGVSKLAVGGAASLAGTLSVQPASATSFAPFSKFAILSAGGGVSGTFVQVVDGLPLPITVQYLPNEVDLSLGGFTGVTRNQIAVASALNASFAAANGDFATVLGLAANLPPAQMQRSLSSFGGQIYGDLAQVSLQDRRLFLGAMDERIRLLGGGSPSAAVLGSLGGGVPGWSGGGNAAQLAAIGSAISNPQLAAADGTGPAPALPGTLWARGFGQFASIDDSGGALGADFSTGGGALGADLIRTPTSLLGVAVSGGQSSVSLNNNPENGTVSFVQFGVYGAQALDYGAAMDGALAYAHDFYDVTRGIVLPGTSRAATSSHGGNDVALDVGISRPIPVDNWQVTPRLGLSYFHIDQASFSESGAGSLDLAVNPAALNALYSRVGVAIAQPMILGDTSILPEFRAAWLHNFLDTQGQFAASFAGAGTASFGQVGAPIGRDAGDLGVGVSFAIAQTALPGQMSGFIQYDATLASHETANAIAAGLRLRW